MSDLEILLMNLKNEKENINVEKLISNAVYESKISMINKQIDSIELIIKNEKCEGKTCQK